jgi:5'-3' exonuclease
MVLNYYKEKIRENVSVLDLAFEWLRGQNIRLEYKKHLNKAQYHDLELAIDDCIFLFFLHYDRHLRKLLKEDIKEYEVSALYETFLSPDSKNINIIEALQEHKSIVPTFYKETKRIDTSIITLRNGIMEVIKEDFRK